MLLLAAVVVVVRPLVIEPFLSALSLGERPEQRKIIADDIVVRQKIEKLAESYDDPKKVVDWYYGEPNRRTQIEEMVIEELLVEQLLEEANVIEKQIDFQVLMNPIESDPADTGGEEVVETT